MTGAEALTYLQRRLAESGLTVEADRTAELFDYLTEGRDDVVAVFASVAPVVVKTPVILEPDAADTAHYTFPAATADPYRVLRVYDAGTGEDLLPSAQLNFDGGHYRWDSLRSLHLGDFVALTGALTVDAVLGAAAIDADTTEAGIGLPTTCHRAMCKRAAVLALTANEESDAAGALADYQREIDKLSTLYGDYDANGGSALREAFLQSLGFYFGDTLY